MIFKKLKERWGITSNFQIVIIFIVFGITGTVSAYISGPLTDFIIGESDIHWLIKLLIRILVLTPIYIKYCFFYLDISFYNIDSFTIL